MNDKSLVKIICRIITLINYITILTSLFLMYEFIPLVLEDKINILFENHFIVILICVIPLLITMIVALILKYTLKEDSKVTPYRILDVITRTFCTIPITICIHYYITQNENYTLAPYMIIGILIFIILNTLLKFTLQETMNASFIKSDSL